MSVSKPHKLPVTDSALDLFVLMVGVGLAVFLPFAGLALLVWAS